MTIRVDYFLGATDDELHTMGVGRDLLPTRDDWLASLRTDAARPIAERDADGVIWELGDATVGFSTTDRIVIGHEAFMHLHVIMPELRRRGLGTRLVQLSARHYFGKFGLEVLHCEPNALNAAPNRTLQRAGFRYEFSYETTPTPINFPQIVTRWTLRRSELDARV